MNFLRWDSNPEVNKIKAKIQAMDVVVRQISTENDLWIDFHLLEVLATQMLKDHLESV